jgi:hypothetical protein
VSGRRLDNDGRLRRVLILANGNALQTTGRLMEALAIGLRRQDHEVVTVLRTFPRGVLAKLRTMISTELSNAIRVARADVVVVHTALSLSLMPMTVARLLRRPVIALVWDIYPDSTRLRGNIRSPALLWTYRLGERLGYRLASALVALSDDYRSALPGRRENVRDLPPWPCDPIRPVEAGRSPHPGLLRIGFAGQVNNIRGLERGLDDLVRSWTGDRIELHVFSRDRCPDALQQVVDAEPRTKLVEHGFLAPDLLQEQLQLLDMGWVCLDPHFSLPAFPSKTMAYLCAGVPILYSGPRMPALEHWLEHNGFGVTARPGIALSPSVLDELTREFPAARSAYLARMEHEWFDLGRLL